MRRPLALLIIAAALAGARAAGAPASPLPELRGVMAVGDVWLASLVRPDARAQEWRRPGERCGEFTIAVVEAQSVTLLDAQGEVRVLRLPDAAVVGTQTPPADPIEWQRWVNSSDNPMLDRPAEPPGDMRRWRDLPAERHQEITAWYASHGWQLVVDADDHSPPAIEFAPLLGEQRQAILAQKQHAFLRGLSPEQRTLHTAAFVPIKLGDGSRDTAVELFKTSLTPLQREAFRLLRDFTTPFRGSGH